MLQRASCNAALEDATSIMGYPLLSVMIEIFLEHVAIFRWRNFTISVRIVKKRFIILSRNFHTNAIGELDSFDFSCRIPFDNTRHVQITSDCDLLEYTALSSKLLCIAKEPLWQSFWVLGRIT